MKYKPRDFFDVRVITKIFSVHRYLYRVAYAGQKPVKTRFFADPNSMFAHAWHDHYCITLIECPFEFNFESLLSHFGWFCQFMYFNFAETTLQFEVLKGLKERELTPEEIDLLLNILRKNPEPYQFELNAYQDKAKFALMKRQSIGEKGTVTPFLERDKYFRQIFTQTLETKKEQLAAQIVSSEPQKVYQSTEILNELSPIAKKYEPSLYNYLKLNDNLTYPQQTIIINFLYDLLKDNFYKEISLKEFEAAFYNEQSEPIMIDISKSGAYKFDAQKMHWLLRSLKDNQILTASWDIVQKKINVYNQQGHFIKSVYQISGNKISSQKRRQVENLLQPLFDRLPDQLPR